jgi:hypothetical protein
VPEPRPGAPGARWRVGAAIVRNGVAVVGAFGLDWSPATLLFLYFADTLARLWAIVAAVLFHVTGVDAAERPGDALHGLASALALGLLVAAVLAVPLGMPLLFVLGIPGAWPAAVNDPALGVGVAVIGATALAWTLRHWWTMTGGPAGEASVKREFAIVLARWILVLFAAPVSAGLLGRYAPHALVLVYAAATVWSDLAPDRVANLFSGRRSRPPGSAGGP